MKKAVFLFAIIFIITSTTGCWNRRELSDLGIIGAAAIDAEGDRVRMTYEIISPIRLDTKTGQSELATYFQSEGETIFDANRNATLKFDKKLFWSHANVYFFNEKAAQNGMLTYLDYFNRNHESRRFVNIAIVKGRSAFEIMGVDGSQGDVPSSFVEKLYENYSSNGKSASIKILDFLKAYYAEGIEPVVGVVEIVKRSEDKLTIPILAKEQVMASTEGLAVFKDDQLKGFLNGIQTRAYNFVIGKIKSGVIVSTSPDGKGKNSLEIIEASGGVDVEIKNGKYSGKVEISVSGELNEETGKKDISSIEELGKIQDSSSLVVKQEIENSIKAVQGLGSDVFGFGQAVHKKYPEIWKKIKNNWNTIFSTLQVVVKVKSTIQGIGVSDEQISAK